MKQEHSSSLTQTLTAADTTQVSWLDRWLAKSLLNLIGNPPVTFRLWNGEEVITSKMESTATLKIKNRHSLIKLLIDPEFNFGELYCTNDIDVEGDLSRFLQKVYPAIHYRQSSIITRLVKSIRHRRSDNKDLTNTRKNIHHHYDIGNEFYKHWLDREAMQYTCAYYPDPSMQLEEAQLAKMHHVCRKLRLAPGLTVVEAGCGWGGLASFMASEYGVRVKAYNISHEQIRYAKARIKDLGLDDRVEYIEDDFRNIKGRYDRFVSIGMLEHIGIDNYLVLGNIINRSLNDEGFGLIHTIGRNQPCKLNAWIEARIFPGACPPSLGQMMELFEPAAFSILDVENLRLHYAKTLEHWLQRFDDNLEEFKKQYDEFFIRTWRLYLAGSIAAFETGTMQLFQVLFTRPRNNHLEWSRAHLYQPRHKSG